MPIYMALAGAGVAGHWGTRSLMMLKDKYGFKDYEGLREKRAEIEH